MIFVLPVSEQLARPEQQLNGSRIGKEGVVGEGEAIEPGFHSERGVDRQVTRSPSHRLPEGGQLRLALRVGAAHHRF